MMEKNKLQFETNIYTKSKKRNDVIIWEKKRKL